MNKSNENIMVSFFIKSKVCIIWKYFGCLFQSTIYRNTDLSDANIEYESPMYVTLEEAYRDLFLKDSILRVNNASSNS